MRRRMSLSTLCTATLRLSLRDWFEFVVVIVPSTNKLLAGSTEVASGNVS